MRKKELKAERVKDRTEIARLLKRCRIVGEWGKAASQKQQRHWLHGWLRGRSNGQETFCKVSLTSYSQFSFVLGEHSRVASLGHCGVARSRRCHSPKDSFKHQVDGAQWMI
jgi:hypothetical protein